jgi:hypothetical protein
MKMVEITIEKYPVSPSAAKERKRSKHFILTHGLSNASHQYPVQIVFACIHTHGTVISRDKGYSGIKMERILEDQQLSFCFSLFQSAGKNRVGLDVGV